MKHWYSRIAALRRPTPAAATPVVPTKMMSTGTEEKPRAAEPRLSVCILTRNSADRLVNLIAEIACFADQIVIGVDAESTDKTYAIATQYADRVFHFSHPAGQLAGARMMIFDYADGDWILSLDDDETITDSFDTLLPSLLSVPGITHYWFQRQWIVDRHAYTYLRAPLWCPDWQLRLFRNDRSLVWKTPKAHSGYAVQGYGVFEPRVALHHFEPLLLSDAQRREKLAMYEKAAPLKDTEQQYTTAWQDLPRARAAPRLNRRPVTPRNAGVESAGLAPDIRDATPHPAPWAATILAVDMPAQINAGQAFVVEATVKNSGGLSWTPANLSRRGPRVALAYHILHTDGTMLLQDGLRCDLPRTIRPGETATFLYHAHAPAKPGVYIFEWDMVCEFETWFAAAGSTTLKIPVQVTP